MFGKLKTMSLTCPLLCFWVPQFLTIRPAVCSSDCFSTTVLQCFLCLIKAYTVQCWDNGLRLKKLGRNKCFLCLGELSCGCCCRKITMNLTTVEAVSVSSAEQLSIHLNITTGISHSACQQNGAAAAAVLFWGGSTWLCEENAVFVAFRRTTRTRGLINESGWC